MTKVRSVVVTTPAFRHIERGAAAPYRPLHTWIHPGSQRAVGIADVELEIRIGMPRVLNMYSQTPVFTGYFASLGIKAENLVYYDFTSEELYKEGSKRGAIDPCFPSKLGIPHVHNLLNKVHAKKPLDIIFFPMIDCLTTDLYNVQASRARGEQTRRGRRLSRAAVFRQRDHARRRARCAGATGARGPAGRGAAGPAVS
jgi:hypothetical protein